MGNATILVVHQAISVRNASEHKSPSRKVEKRHIARFKRSSRIRHLGDTRSNRFGQQLNLFYWQERYLCRQRCLSLTWVQPSQINRREFLGFCPMALATNSYQGQQECGRDQRSQIRTQPASHRTASACEPLTT